VRVVKLQQRMAPVQSAVAVASTVSSRPAEQYVPTSDTYWPRSDSEHSYRSAPAHNHGHAASARYRSVFVIVKRISSVFWLIQSVSLLKID